MDLIAPAAEGQARQDFNEERLQALAESLRRSGVREPIIVTPHGTEQGRFQIVAGERRWRAAQLAGLKEIPCIVDPGLVEWKDKLLAQAEENLHRENLNAVEEAAVLAQLMEARGIDAKEAGELLGKSQRQAQRLLQLHAAAAPIKVHRPGDRPRFHPALCWPAPRRQPRLARSSTRCAASAGPPASVSDSPIQRALSR